MKRGKVRTPTLLQMEAVECGAAALGIILGYYRRYVPLAELRAACGVSRDGSKASNVLKAARALGCVAKGYSKSLDAFKEVELPCIVFWQFNHFLVVEGYDDERVFLNDPASGHRSVTWDEFDTSYTGVVLTVAPGPEFKTGGKRPSVRSAVISRVQGSVGALLYCFLAGLLLVLPGLALPTYMRVFLDSVIVEMRTDWFRPLLVIMATTILLQLGLKLLQLFYLRRLRVALSIRLASQFFWHLLRLPVSFYAQRFPGEITERSTLNDKLAATLSGELVIMCIEIVTMLFYAVVMFYYDWTLTLVGIGFAAANFIALRCLARGNVEANMRLAQETGKTYATAIAGIQSMETFKASGLESGFFAKWSGSYAKSSNARQELEAPALGLGTLPSLLQQLAIVLILVAGGLRVISGELSIGMLIAFQGLMTSFLMPVAGLVGFGGKLQQFQGDLVRLEDVLNNPAADPQPQKGDYRISPLTHVRLRGEVTLDEVTFGYSPLDPPLIDGLSLHVRPGQRVALVGGSGSGKSTLAKLVAGLFEPWSGSIRFDGCRRAEIDPAVLSNSVGMVDQDVLLFEGSIRENLTLWDNTFSHEMVARACQDAGIHETILALPGGYDAMLLEGGVNLSGGQRQRLEIARALLNNPSVLVLDEATSALDSETERVIDENLRRRGCSCLIVAHRLSTIRDCDEIIVLERGKVVERGTHEELWQAGGYYAGLIQHEGS